MQKGSPPGLTREWERAVFPVAVFSRSSRSVTDTASFVLSTNDGWLLDLSLWAVEWRSERFLNGHGQGRELEPFGGQRRRGKPRPPGTGDKLGTGLAM